MNERGEIKPKIEYLDLTVLELNPTEGKTNDIDSSLFKNSLKWVSIGALVLGFLYGFLWLTRK